MSFGPNPASASRPNVYLAARNRVWASHAAELLPDSGIIWLADNVRIISFDQKREQLDQSQTLRRALAPEGDSR